MPAGKPMLIARFRHFALCVCGDAEVAKATDKSDNKFSFLSANK